MLHGDRFIADQRCQFLALKGRRAQRFTMDGARVFFGQPENRQVALWQTYRELLERVNLRIDCNFVLERRKLENFRKETIRLLAVIELIIVRAGIAVLVKLERVFLSVQFEKAPDVIENVRL